MDTSWRCQVCEHVADTAPQLAEHLMFWHDEWITTGQVPPMRKGDPFLSF